MHFISEISSGGVSQRGFTVDGVPGVLWQPDGLPHAGGVNREGLHGAGLHGAGLHGAGLHSEGRHAGRPLVLLGHGGGGDKLRMAEQARRCVARYGFAAVALDAPGHGERPRTAQDERFVTEIAELLAARRPISAWVARHTAALAERAVPEWVAVLDALGEAGEDFGPVGFWGLSLGSVVGIPLAAAEPRIAAAVFGLAGHAAQTEAAARVNVPMEFVLQWDDELVPREGALALFGAFGSREKTLHANPGGHVEVPEFQLAASERFLARHLAQHLGRDLDITE